MTAEADAHVSATKAVRALFEAFRYRHREDAEKLIAGDFTFTSPYDDHIDRAAYFERCWPNGDRFKDFRIERTASDEDGVYVTYFCTTNDGKSFRNTEYLTSDGREIHSTDVYFGATYESGSFVPQQPD
jgi:hypothetical protein